MKRFVSVIGIVAAIIYSYYQGYIAGYVDGLETSSLENEDDSTTTVGPQDSSSQSKTDESSSEDIPCKDDDCSQTFETEHGMKIHYGRVHKTDT